MTTPADLIKRSLRILGVKSSGESLSNDEASDGLEALNSMLEDWRNDKLMAYAMQDETITMQATKSSYTLGPTGDTVTTRPVKIENAFIRDGTIDYPVGILSRDKWDGIPDKTSTTDIVQSLLVEGTMNDTTIKTWPVPNKANVLHLRTWVVISSLTINQTIALPPGYTNAIVYNLAIHQHPEYPEKPLSGEVVKIADTSLGGIKRINSRPIKARNDLAGLFDNVSHNIISDTVR